MLSSLTCEYSVWNSYWEILFGGRNNSKQLSLTSERNACAVSSVGCNLSRLRREVHLVITPFNFINGPYKVRFGENIAAADTLSNLIYIGDRVFGSSYCFVSSSHINDEHHPPTSVTGLTPVVGTCTGSLMSWDHSVRFGLVNSWTTWSWCCAVFQLPDAAENVGYLPWRTSPMVFESPFPYLKQF